MERQEQVHKTRDQGKNEDWSKIILSRCKRERLSLLRVLPEKVHKFFQSRKKASI